MKTKLSYLLCVTTIGFGSASLQASDNKPTVEQRAKHVECFTHISNEENIGSYERCLKTSGISENEAAELRKDMYKELGNSVKSTINKYFPKDKNK
ncbi:hypothetical protein IM40_02990 [Candidatus Paracaedimonas acanthamoebae]|nr:hypothetical protein IM40_02990 [Candidatus Paracaedimonas acanthamoebae]